MTTRPPRTADEALALALGVAPSTAAATRRALGIPTGGDLDSEIRALAALADLGAAKSLTDVDLEDAALSENPAGALREVLQQRSDRSLRASIAAHESWANTSDRSARTAPARAALMAKFEREVDPDGVLPPDERARRAEHKRRAYFQRLALKSAKARRARRADGDAPGRARG